jgi:hypothetical protein
MTIGKGLREFVSVVAELFFGLRLGEIYLTIQFSVGGFAALGLLQRTPPARFSFNTPSLDRMDWLPWVGCVLLILVGIQILASLVTLWLPEMNFAEKHYYADATRYNTTTSLRKRSGWKKNLYASVSLVFGVASAIIILGMVMIY